ncbi:MAG: hypothetical protein ABI557_18590 [Aureliella sp.]
MERLNLTVDDGISDILVSLAGSGRKQGEWLGELLRAIKQGRDVGDGGRLTKQEITVEGVCGRLNELEGRLLRLEAVRKVD